MSEQNNIADLRKDYNKSELLETDVATNPLVQFKQWFQIAMDSNILEPTAMQIATVSSSGQPSMRTVLLKGINEQGIIFYTNYNSRKGQELANNNKIAVHFFWDVLEKQVRMEGIAERISEQASDQYFNSRPKGSRIGAWASPQSSVIDDRAVLRQNVDQLNQQYQHTDQVPRPPHWGGYVVKAHYFEFWQGRSSRLHDRICYTYQIQNNSWQIQRLAP